MSTNVDLRAANDDELDVQPGDLAGYFHPREIVADASLTVWRRRALLAHWLSDANAVLGMPGLRRSDAGVTTTVDDLTSALAELDESHLPGPVEVAAQQAA